MKFRLEKSCYKLPVAFIWVCFNSLFLNAQTAITTSGGNATGTGGAVSYTVGQVVFTTNSSINGSVAQGVQQPFEISTVTAIEDINGISLECQAYPNPVTDVLILKFDSNVEDYAYQLFDIKGKLLNCQPVTNSISNIPMKNLSNGTYFLKVNRNSQNIKTFKIIKN
jgi:hypothetical protein